MDQKYVETEQKLRLYVGDTVAAVDSVYAHDEKSGGGGSGQANKVFRFGVVNFNENYGRFIGKTEQEIKEAQALYANISQNGVSECLGRVLWKHRAQKQDLDLSRKYLIMNRKFRIGQRVTNSRGHQGEVIGMREFAIVQVVSTDKVIKQEVPLDRLVPASPLFCGVQVEFHGWMGLITAVDRAFRIECNGKPATVTLVKEPIKNVVKKPSGGPDSNAFSWSVQVDRQYPFTARTSRSEGGQSKILYYGAINQKPSSKFTPNVNLNAIRMNDVLNQGSAWTFMRGLLENPSNSQYKVTHSSVGCITVTWLTKIPSLEGPDEKPPQILAKSNLEKLKSFWIQPNQYIYKNGICLYQKRPEDEIIDLTELDKRICETIDNGRTKFTDPFGEETVSPGRKKKDRIDPNHAPLAVHTLVIRTSYKIKWDHAAIPQNHFGDELEALAEESTSTVPFIFAKKTGCSDDNFYGVVRGRVKDKFRLQWLTINSTNATVEHCLSVESFKDIAPHSKFNRLRIGTPIYVNVDAKAKAKYGSFETSGFQYGSVKEVDRHFFGKILVHCSKDNCEKWMWPFQLNIITIDHKSAGSP